MARVGGDVPGSLSTHRQFETELHFFTRETRCFIQFCKTMLENVFKSSAARNLGNLTQFSSVFTDFLGPLSPAEGDTLLIFFSRGRLQAQRGAGSSGQFTEPWTCLTSLCTNYVRLLAKNRHRYREERAFRSFSKMKSLGRGIIDASASVIQNAKML